MKKQSAPGKSAGAAQARRNPGIFSPSAEFAEYIRLSRLQNASAANDSQCDGALPDRRCDCDSIAARIGRSRAFSLSGVFEKLYIWRTECFEPSATGFAYFNDIFPLSVYFDLKDMVRSDRFHLSSDVELLANLRTWREPD